MQGLWSNHRRMKLNLNQPIPVDVLDVVTPARGAMTPQGNECVPSTSTDLGELSLGAQPSGNAPTDINGASATPSKRKDRSSRVAPAHEYPQKRRKATSAATTEHTPPTTRLSDLGGVQPCVEKMLELVAMPLCHPEVYLHTGVQPPRGVLLHGPPGCGKTLLANAIAGEIGVPFISISAPSIVSGMSGESEKTLRETFEEAKRVAPCLLFIDEIDAITPKRESAQREMERRIVAQFLTCMDDLAWEKTDNRAVMVIGATNRPDSLDAALRRAGRFDHEITMGVPDESAREQILRVQSAKLRLDGDLDLRALAKATPGFVGADLAALTGAAGVIAVKRIFRGLAEGSIVLPDCNGIPVEQNLLGQIDPPNPVADSSLHVPFASLSSDTLPATSIAHFLRAHPNALTDSQLSPLVITSEDFKLALTEVQPSSKREGFATIPDVTWADVGALDGVREELSMAVVHPLRRPDLFKLVGMDAPCGVLLWGPPGCGKTLLAKAVANESRANFINVKGPELLNKYVGESERAVRQVFTRARASSPCIIFFDELDALVPRRDDSLSESSSRVVNTLLTELDGLESRGKSVYVIAATNRPDMIDPAMCRPGRLDKLLYVDLPNAAERVEIMRTLVGVGRKGSKRSSKTKSIPVQGDFDGKVFQDVQDLIGSARADGYSGADIASWVREAAVGALKSHLVFQTLGAKEAEGDAGDDDSMMGMEPGSIEVGFDDFERALEKIAPSVSAVQRRRYEALRSKFAGLPVGHGHASSGKGPTRDDVKDEVDKSGKDSI
ncbi:hypothetical protein FRB95_013538 [Tulasnella sp. JGI-2019a]|nr:hypothetical protein FRB95_013538 [Tulasnella sp. JGI-2019a]